MGTRVRQTKEGESQLRCGGPWKGHGEQRRVAKGRGRDRERGDGEEEGEGKGAGERVLSHGSVDHNFFLPWHLKQEV